MKTITYNGAVLEYKSSHRALVDYEMLAGKDKVDTYIDSLKLMHCIVKTQAKRNKVPFNLEFDEFVDWLDENPNALQGIVVDKKAAPSPEGDVEEQKKS